MSRPQSGSAQLCWAWCHSGNASADLLIPSRHGTEHVWATPLSPTDRWGLCWNTCTELNLLLMKSPLEQPWVHPSDRAPAGAARAGQCPPRQGTARVAAAVTQTSTGWTLPPAPAQTGSQHKAKLRKHTRETFVQSPTPKPLSSPESRKITRNSSVLKLYTSYFLFFALLQWHKSQHYARWNDSSHQLKAFLYVTIKILKKLFQMS